MYVNCFNYFIQPGVIAYVLVSSVYQLPKSRICVPGVVSQLTLEEPQQALLIYQYFQ